MDLIYLDHASTSPIDPRVVDRMRDAYLNVFGNGASQHRVGRRARQVLDDAADEITAMLGARANRADADRVIFTSGGTEANNLALRGLAGPTPGRLIVSAIEHASVLETAESMRQAGWQVDLLRVDSQGSIDLAHLLELLAMPPLPRLVSVMLGNNETGVLQPINSVVDLCHTMGIPVHTDAVQVVGKMPVSFDKLQVDAMTVAAHKLHGPCGVGALVVRSGVKPRPILFGGAQQLEWRPGTEPVALAVGFQTAMELYQSEAASRREHLQTCRDQLELRLREAIPTVEIHGFNAPRLPQTSSVSFPGIDRQSLLIALDMAGVCCSTGSACASGSSQPSHVLQAMGLPAQLVESGLRFSVGATTTLDEIHQAADRIERAVRQLGS